MAGFPVGAAVKVSPSRPSDACKHDASLSAMQIYLNGSVKTPYFLRAWFAWLELVGRPPDNETRQAGRRRFTGPASNQVRQERVRLALAGSAPVAPTPAPRERWWHPTCSMPGAASPT